MRQRFVIWFGLVVLGPGLALGCRPAAQLASSTTPDIAPTAVSAAAPSVLPLSATPAVSASANPTLGANSIQATPASTAGLPFTGTLLIADAGNNRLLEVTVDKRIVWTFPVADSLPATRTFRYPDDAFCSPDGRYISVNEESNHVVSVIDYATRRLVWQFGYPGRPGSDLQHLNTPDDARLLRDGRVAVADIKNCRILIISWDQKDVKSIGTPRDCSGKPGSLNSPNGVTPLPNGNLLVTEIHTHRVSEIDLEGRVVRAVVAPLTYPSDAFLTG